MNQGSSHVALYTRLPRLLNVSSVDVWPTLSAFSFLRSARSYISIIVLALVSAAYMVAQKFKLDGWIVRLVDL
jgi:hypothetical protein